MTFEWDEEKNRANIRNHKIAFEDAVKIFDGPVLNRIVDRFDYGELRTLSTGLLFGVSCVVVVHTDRNGNTRIISARKADKGERKAYDDEFF